MQHGSTQMQNQLISVAPTGKLIQCTTFDCDQKNLDRVLQNYDHQLYTKWNPKKKGGMGCWEIRRRPTLKTAIPTAEFEGATIYCLEYYELDIVHHVMDLPCLTYRSLDWLRDMDTFQTKNWVSSFEDREQRAKEEAEAKNKAELRYKLKHSKQDLQRMMEAVRSGVNPFAFFTGPKKR